VDNRSPGNRGSRQKAGASPSRLASCRRLLAEHYSVRYVATNGSRNAFCGCDLCKAAERTLLASNEIFRPMVKKVVVDVREIEHPMRGRPRPPATVDIPPPGGDEKG
jgi:hypothetical protein